LNIKNVFGDPIQQGDVVVIPAAKIRAGGGGGGQKPGTGESGSRGGFGLQAMPAGAFVFKNGKLYWKPAIDANRIVLGAQLVVLVALLTFGRALARRLRR
jgi:uncharacterized spore protein YtfJ